MASIANIAVEVDSALRAEIDRLNLELQKRDKCSYMGPMRDCPTHGEGKDAARYRWLRDTAYHATAGPNGKMTWCVTWEGCSTEEPIYGEALDAAIDATMKTQNAELTERRAEADQNNPGA